MKYMTAEHAMKKATLVATLMTYVVTRNAKSGVAEEMTGAEIRAAAEKWADFLIDRYTDGTTEKEQKEFIKDMEKSFGGHNRERKSGNIFLD